MNIYSETKPFKPTFLYIKQHSVTGLLYFGKTTRKDPEKYMGSGVHWTRHINKHGKEHVVTLWYCLFYDKQECKEFALSFSKQQNIMKSKMWANLIEENGTNYGHPGHHTTKTKIKIGKAKSNPSEETRAKLSKAKKGIPQGPNPLKGRPGNLNGMHHDNWNKHSEKEKLRREKQSKTKRSKTKEQNLKSYSRRKSNEEKLKLSNINKMRRITRIKDRKEMNVSNFLKYLKLKPHLY
jgi:hypothetical protein